MKNDINKAFEKWWDLNCGRYDVYMTTKKCGKDAFESRDAEVKKLKTQVKNLKAKLKDAIH